jgi:ADP-ribose pyrophosphatase YjhB (NUDIX family)
MYRIFRGRHLLLISSNKSHVAKHEPDFLLKKPTQKEVVQALSICKKSRRPLKFLLLGSEEKILKQLLKEFEYVEAAGGLVENTDGNLLLMKRLGKWDLPKGKNKKGENHQVCALREVEEETGAKDLSITDYFAETFHTYYRNRKWQIKHTYWYLMTCKNGQELKPQTEEDIEEVLWVNPKKIKTNDLNTYPAIKHLLNKYLKLKKKLAKASAE